MDKRLLQDFAVSEKDNLEKQIEVSLKTLGINSEKDIKASKVMGDVTVIDGDPASYPASLHSDRQKMIRLIKTEGYEHVIEEFAYTWFNRLVALRFMEVHGFLSHGFRVLSDPSGSVEPEIMKNLAFAADEIGLDMAVVSQLKDAGKSEELYRYVLFCQCRSLSGILPMLFSEEESYLQLLLPRNLLKGETIVTRLAAIPEEYFLEDVEIIGWLYQFYLSAKKDKVNASKKTITKDTLPAVTQLFTPEWIVRYMTENSLGRLWLESYPDSPLRDSMNYYVPDPEQTDEVRAKLEEIRYKNVNPKDIKIIEPCCGSGHILVYLFDLLYKIYDEKGYSKRDIPTLILQNNLHGLDVDKRASQLAAFSLIMKARSVNPQFFRSSYYTVPKVYEIYDSTYLLNINYETKLEEIGVLSKPEIAEIRYIVEAFRYGKTIGSLLKLEKIDFELVDNAVKKIKNDVVDNLFIHEFITDGVELLEHLIAQAKIMRQRYDILITNPPYLSPSKMEQPMKDYAVKNYPFSKADMFAMFMETPFVKPNGFTAMINMHSWMFLSSFEKMRENLLQKEEIITMAHLGAHAFETIGGEVVQTTTFVLRNAKLGGNGVYFRLVDSKDKEADFMKGLAE